MDMKEIIKDWKRNAKRRSDQNFRYIRRLKNRNRKRVDAVANQLHEEAFDKIDCLKCGNCCRVSTPLVEKGDIKRISKFLELSESEFKEKYVEKGEFGDLLIAGLPCSFFNEEDNKCGIYEVRPSVCQSFPHTHKEGFASRTYVHIRNTEVCPATYYIVERMKDFIR